MRMTSFIVDFSSCATEGPSGKKAIGYLDLVELDRVRSEQDSKPHWKVVIILEDENNKLCRLGCFSRSINRKNKT